MDKKQDNQVNYSGKAVKQGNSLCIRIPNFVKKELDIREGNELIVSIQKAKMKYSEEYVSYMLKIADKVKKLDKYSQEKKKFFLRLNFDYVEESIDENDEVKYKKIESMKKEFGSRLINDWLRFEEILNKESFETDRHGYTSLKKEFR